MVSTEYYPYKIYHLNFLLVSGTKFRGNIFSVLNFSTQILLTLRSVAFNWAKWSLTVTPLHCRGCPAQGHCALASQEWSLLVLVGATELPQ